MLLGRVLFDPKENKNSSFSLESYTGNVMLIAVLLYKLVPQVEITDLHWQQNQSQSRLWFDFHVEPCGISIDRSRKKFGVWNFIQNLGPAYPRSDRNGSAPRLLVRIGLAFTRDLTDPIPFGSAIRTGSALLSKVAPFGSDFQDPDPIPCKHPSTHEIGSKRIRLHLDLLSVPIWDRF